MADEEVVVEGTMEDGTDLSAAVDDIASSALPDEVIGDEGDEAAAKEPTPAAKGTTAAPSVPGAVGGGQAAPAPGNLDPNATQCPDTLTGEVKELWAQGKIDPKVQAEMIRREGDFRQFRDQVSGPVELGSGYMKMLDPYLPVLRQYGVNPVQHTEDLLKYHAVLMFGTPQQKAEIISGLATDSGIDLRALAAGALQVLPGNHQERQLAEMRSQLQGMGNRFTQQDSVAMESHIRSLAANTEEYPHFWELAPAMIQELNANPRLPIDQAYRVALAANRALYDSVLNIRAQKNAAKTAAEARERADKARKAKGVNLQSSSGVRPASRSKLGSGADIGAAVDDAFADLQSR